MKFFYRYFITAPADLLKCLKFIFASHSRTIVVKKMFGTFFQSGNSLPDADCPAVESALKRNSFLSARTTLKLCSNFQTGILIFRLKDLVFAGSRQREPVDMSRVQHSYTLYNIVWNGIQIMCHRYSWWNNPVLDNVCGHYLWFAHAMSSAFD